MKFPERKEYSDYYENYVKLLAKKDPLVLLKQTHDYVMSILIQLNEKDYDNQYQSDKWTIRQLLIHLLDCEQILCYRALRFARNDFKNALAFDEDEYVRAADLQNKNKKYILKSLKLMRQNTLHLFSGFSEAEHCRGGSEAFPNTVRAIAAIISGHELHHIYVLQKRYLKQEIQTIEF
jgi:hypothetical protein